MIINKYINKNNKQQKLVFEQRQMNYNMIGSDNSWFGKHVAPYIAFTHVLYLLGYSFYSWQTE